MALEVVRVDRLSARQKMVVIRGTQQDELQSSAAANLAIESADLPNGGIGFTNSSIYAVRKNGEEITNPFDNSNNNGDNEVLWQRDFEVNQGL